jgi:Sec-independent protein translocase protein TatA
MIFKADSRACTLSQGPPAGASKDGGVFSVPDVLFVSILALLLFGPDRLPKIMRQAGRFMREVQNTSQSFVAEMERAADAQDDHGRPEAENDRKERGG